MVSPLGISWASSQHGGLRELECYMVDQGSNTIAPVSQGEAMSPLLAKLWKACSVTSAAFLLVLSTSECT